MKIKYISENGRIEVVISDDSDWNLFNRTANFIAEKFNGQWLEKVDGLDQRYWDMKIEDKILVLHLEHYTGIKLLPTKSNDAEANNLVREIGSYLEINFL